MNLKRLFLVMAAVHMAATATTSVVAWLRIIDNASLPVVLMPIIIGTLNAVAAAIYVRNYALSGAPRDGQSHPSKGE